MTRGAWVGELFEGSICWGPLTVRSGARHVGTRTWAPPQDGASLHDQPAGRLILVPIGLSHSLAAVLLGRLEHGEVVFWDGCDPSIWKSLPVSLR